MRSGFTFRVIVVLWVAGWGGLAAEQVRADAAANTAGHAPLVARLQARIDEARGALPAPADDFIVALSLVDLDDGARLSMAAEVPLHAASTMKVPVLFELFRQADAGELSLDDSIHLENRFRSIVDGSEYSLSPDDDSDSTLYARIGDEATYRELARLMIVRSSNLATNLLIDRVDAGRVRATLARLGASGMHVLRGVEDTPAYRAGLNNTTTAAGFARALEAIARCEMLTAGSCREIIDVLGAQEFDEGIPAGVPEGVRVANKTGWITGISHDGAIVYPAHREPYVLVVLTRGFEDPAAATRLIADLSGIVWREMTGGPPGEQHRQQRQVRQQSDDHGQRGEPPEDHARHEAGGHEQREAEGDDRRGVEDRDADAAVGAEGRSLDVVLAGQLEVAVHVVDGVVHGNTHCDRGDGDGHHVQLDTQPAHGAEHGGCRQQVRYQRDQGHPQ